MAEIEAAAEAVVTSDAPATEQIQEATEQVQEQVQQEVKPEGQEQTQQENKDYVPLGKYMELRKDFRGTKSRIQELERMLSEMKEGPSVKSEEPPTELKGILAGLQSANEEDRIKALAAFGKMNAESAKREYENQQRSERYGNFVKESEGWFKKRPEAKGDPEFEYNIVDIIRQNPAASEAVAAGKMSPDSYRRYIMSEYAAMMNPETEESKIKDAESSRSARVGAGSPQGGGNPRGKKVWTDKEVREMSPEDYVKNKDEIMKAVEEGRVRD